MIDEERSAPRPPDAEARWIHHESETVCAPEPDQPLRHDALGEVIFKCMKGGDAVIEWEGEIMQVTKFHMRHVPNHLARLSAPQPPMPEPPAAKQPAPVKEPLPEKPHHATLPGGLKMPGITPAMAKQPVAKPPAAGKTKANAGGGDGLAFTADGVLHGIAVGSTVKTMRDGVASWAAVAQVCLPTPVLTYLRTLT